MERWSGGAGRLDNKYSPCFLGLIAVGICQDSAYERRRNYRPLKLYTPTETCLIAATGLQHTGRDAPNAPAWPLWMNPTFSTAPLYIIGKWKTQRKPMQTQAQHVKLNSDHYLLAFRGTTAALFLVMPISMLSVPPLISKTIWSGHYPWNKLVGSWKLFTWGLICQAWLQRGNKAFKSFN